MILLASSVSEQMRSSVLVFSYLPVAKEERQVAQPPRRFACGLPPSCGALLRSVAKVLLGRRNLYRIGRMYVEVGSVAIHAL